MSRHALIIGGSLGGLFAAHLLRASGWHVDVFERSTEDLAGRGLGLGTHDAMIAVLRRIGIDTESRLGVPTHSYVWLDRSGGVIQDVPLPRVMTAWARLYRPLKDALPAQHYHAGKALVRVEQDGRSVSAIFADGTRATGDLLIGADGARSALRAQMLPQAKPVYAGYVAWRALLAEAAVAPADRELLFTRNAFCIPDGELLVSYPVPARDGDLRPGKRDYNIVWYRPVDDGELADLNTDASGQRHEQIPPPSIRADLVAAVKAAGRALLASSLADIFERTARPSFQAIYDLAAPQLVFGRAVLIGDAAFVARPHVGAGVTKAALDAACLADALAGSDDIDAALAHHGRTRKEAGDWIVARGRSFGEACIGGKTGSSTTGRARKADAAWRQYIGMPAEIREWSRQALAGAHGSHQSCPPSPQWSSSAQ